MSECIIWKGCVKNGYGWRTWKRQTTTAHRIEYCIGKGIDLADIEGMIIRHKCDNPLCINPDHLVVGTQQQNVNDMYERHRECRKIPLEIISAIKNEYEKGSSTHGSPALAKKYGVSQPHIIQIVNGTALSGSSVSDWVSAFGVRKMISEWAKDEICTVTAKTILRRILSGIPPEQAISSKRRSDIREAA